jgi:hypothetical protein
MEPFNSTGLIRFSQLSPSRQTLVRLCQSLNFGLIRCIHVRDASPVFDPMPVVLIDARLDADEKPRPEVELTDFVLRDEVCRLMARLDELKNGTIDRIEVRAGVPRRIVFAARLTEAKG